MIDRLQQALGFHRAGRLDDAERLYLVILKGRPHIFDAVHLLGLVQLARGRSSAGVTLIKTALAINPDHPDAWNNLGFALQAVHEREDAVAAYRRALALRPAHAEASNNLGNVLKELGRFDEAIECYRKTLQIDPRHADAHNNLGNVLKSTGSLDEAIACYRHALACNPSHAEAHYNLGNAMQSLKRYDEAIACYRNALALKPDYTQALNNLGRVFQDLKRFDEALASYRQALAAEPSNAEALNNLGSVLRELKRPGEAIACFQQALALRPDYAEPYSNLGNVSRDQKKPEEAIASYRQALRIDPAHADACYNLGMALKDLKRHEEAIDCYHTTLRLMPEHRYALGMLADSELKTCNWRETEKLSRELSMQVKSGAAIVSPFTFFGYTDSPEELHDCTRRYVRDNVPQPPAPLWNGERYRHDRIRLAYLSADFHQHATAYLMAELFELHDHAQFEVIGISFGPDDKSDIRARMIRAFDEFHDVRSISDAEVARMLRALEVDIAVDLKGFTQDARLGILSYRPAPVQVNYLGYPGTMGADFIDYIIADRWTAPFEHQHCYSEKIVHLPDCYQANDGKRMIAPATPTRAECSLPEQGFVFCCFNNNYKITAEVFAIWMRLLHAVEGSVIWLLSDNAAAENNLRREAGERGIDPARLVFAPRMALDRHLARHRLADLFLDTLPVNAHTTASDALWAGLPVLTCVGGTFAGRVAASLLHAVGLPELVAGNLHDYEALALTLATNAAELTGVRAKLERNRAASPLFDADRLRRNLESAYQRMWDTLQQGEGIRGFAV
jgi:protein O-GlcNAc transferase